MIGLSSVKVLLIVLMMIEEWAPSPFEPFQCADALSFDQFVPVITASTEVN